MSNRSKLGSYSITSSARASNLSGIWSPSAFAVFRLITNSYWGRDSAQRVQTRVMPKTTLSERCGLFAEHFIDTLRRAMKKGPVSDDGALVP